MVCLEQGNATKNNLTQSVKLQVKLEDLLKEPPIISSSPAARERATCITVLT